MAGHETITALQVQLASVLAGKDDAIRSLLITLLAGGHLLIEDVPGVGKTTLAHGLASSLKSDFGRIQFTADLLPADIIGVEIFDPAKQQFLFHPGAVFNHIVLADEINRAPAKTQSALLEVMQEQQVTIEGQTYELQLPFLALATQNPIEQEGTYPLPQAQLDRFLLKVYIDYPDMDEELLMVKQITSDSVADKLDVSSIQEVLKPEEIISLQRYTSTLGVDEQIVAYAVNIVRTTRDWSGIESGRASCRGRVEIAV